MTEQELMLTSILGCRRIDLFTDNIHLTDEQHKRLQSMRVRRQLNEPLQYILGECEFMGLPLYVDHRVLIPRPETEILVEACIKHVKNIFGDQEILMLDIGTGSGNIAIALAHFMDQAKVTSIDISNDAMAVAYRNVLRHELTQKIDLINLDLLSFVASNQKKFDVIIANPPYIKTSDLAMLPPDVRQEPIQALNGGVDGLDIYRQIIASAEQLLKPGGWIFAEIGDSQHDDLRKLLIDSAIFREPQFIKDYVGIQRVVIAQQKDIK